MRITRRHLKRIRRDILNLTLDMVAADTGYTKGAISNYENGIRKIPEKFARAFCDVYCISENLLDEIDMLEVSLFELKKTEKSKQEEIQ